MNHYLGIDIGTYESKGVLVDGAGRIVASASTRHEMIVPRPGWAEHRAEADWWGDLTRLSRALLADSGVAPASVRALGCSAIGPCMLPVGVDGKPLMNAVLYGVDGRAAREIEDMTADIGESALLATCGNALTSQSVGPKILWLRRNRPEIFRRAARIHTATSYLVERLTGASVVDHYTAASFSPFYDVNRLDWTAEPYPGVVERERLPTLAWSSTVAGHVTAAAARETGLAPGTPVITGTIDAAAEAVSVGVRATGDTMLMYGSTVFIITVTARAQRDPRLWYAPWLFPRRHAALAGLATSGTLTRWFVEQFARELDPADAITRLAAEAEQSPPGARGLVVLPYFSGERTPLHDPAARGVIFGLDLTHRRGDIYRALLEGIACATGHALETFHDIGETPATLLAVGGGTNNRVWTQATSDVAGLGQTVREQTVGASFGDAFLAALGVGDVREEDIERWNPPARRIEPDPATAPLYRRRYAIFRSLYPATRELMHRLADC